MYYEKVKSDYYSIWEVGRTLIAASPYGTLFPCYVGLTTGSFASYCYRVGSYWMFEFNFRSNFGLKKILQK